MQKLLTIALLATFAFPAPHSSASAQGPVVTDAHKVLTHDEGEWTAEMKLWIPGLPEPLSGQGTEINRLIGGGLWVVSEFRATIEGEAFEGHGTFGYDSRSEKYVGTWVDSMSPFMAKMEGTYDAASKTMTHYMEAFEADGTAVRTKAVTVYAADGSRTFTVYNPGEKADEWIKSMEIVYRTK